MKNLTRSQLIKRRELRETLWASALQGPLGERAFELVEGRINHIIIHLERQNEADAKRCVEEIGETPE